MTEIKDDLEFHVSYKDFTELFRFNKLKQIFSLYIIKDNIIKNGKTTNKINTRGIKGVLTNIGIMIVIVILSWAVFAPLLSPYTYKQIISIDQSINQYTPPDSFHLLGTAQFGQDVYSRLIWGARSSLSLGLLSIIISVVGGLIFGLSSAYYQGWYDSIVMKISNVTLAFPTLILTILIVSIMDNEFTYLLVVWGIVGIPYYTRLIRSSTLREKSKLYIKAAKVSGASDFRIMYRHILPNIIAPLIISVSLHLGGIILSFAGLSYLGFGTNNVEWGYDVALNKSKLFNAPWAALTPGLGIGFTVLGFMFLGDGLRDRLDPKN